MAQRKKKEEPQAPQGQEDLEFLDGFAQPDRLPLVPWIQFGHRHKLVIDGEEMEGAFEVPLENLPPTTVELLPASIQIGGTEHPVEHRKVTHTGEGNKPKKVPVVLMRGLHFVFVDQQETEWVDKATGERVAPYSPGSRSTDRYLGVWLDAWPHVRWCKLTVSSKAAQAVIAVRKALRLFLVAVEGRTGRKLPDYAVSVPLFCGEAVATEKGGTVVAIEQGLPDEVPDVAAVRPFIIPTEVRDWLQAEEQQEFLKQWKGGSPQGARGEEVAADYYADDEPVAPFPTQRPPSRRQGRTPRSTRPATVPSGNGALRVRVSVQKDVLPAEYQPFVGKNFGDVLAETSGPAFLTWLVESYEPQNPGEERVVQTAKSVLATLDA